VIVAPGALIANRYRVVRPIASGGMGAVCEVVQAATGARRALKVMHGHISRDERQRSRFVQEARVGATIASDHVAKVLDAGVDDATGMLFIVMDLLEGATLGDELRRRGTFSLHETHDVLRQVCHALDAAHRMGIVHRDIKPSNLFLSVPHVVGMAFMVRVLDFGIAKLAAEVNAGGTAIVGTPTWMSPEQTDQRATVGPATDIWPLGLILFRMLTGYHYFPSGNEKGASTAAMLRETVLDPIVPASDRAAMYGARQTLPLGFDPWFARCVVRDPRQRFSSAQEAYGAFAALAAPYVGLPAGLGPQTDIGMPDKSTTLEHSYGWNPSNQSNPWPQSQTGAPSGAGYAGQVTAPRPAQGSRAGAGIALVLGALVLVGAACAVGWIALRGRAGHSTVSSAGVGPSAASSASSAAPPGRAIVVARLHGSNTIGEELGPALAKAFLERRAGVAAVARTSSGDAAVRIEALPTGGPAQMIEIQARGSGTGFVDLGAGTADIAMSSRRVQGDEAKALAALGDMTSAACENVLGLDGIAIIENSGNPVTKIGKDALAKIFTGDIQRWRDVGGRDAPIVLYARDERSGTLEILRSLVLGGKAIAPTATRFESSEKLSAAVAGDANGIGFVGVAAVRSAKPVMVDGMGTTPLVPSPATIATEDYPLTRRLYLYAPSNASEDTRAFVEFALSDEGQQIVSQAGFVDLRPACDTPADRCGRCPPEYSAAIAHACRVSVTLRFDAASGQLDARALRDMQRLGVFLRRPEHVSQGVILAAFASGPSKDEALSGSEADVQAVATQLRARGVRVLSAKGYGTNAVADDSTPAGREKNRRVEIWLR
jgi:phosphate transport system substrate-binding protein